MNKIRIALVSGVIAAGLMAGSVAHATDATRPVLHEAGPVMCCYSTNMGSHS
jgi:hypothetical protein